MYVKSLSNKKTGLALGGLLAIWHAAWSLLVLFGWAQALFNFIYRVHFLNNPFVIQAFSLKKAAALIVVTGVVGYIMGWVFAWLWNILHKEE